jgi:hypothetical protein
MCGINTTSLCGEAAQLTNQKTDFSLKAGAASPHPARVPKGHVVLMCGFAAQPKRLWRMHSAARSAAHEGEKVEFALQAGAASPHRGMT